MIKNLSAIEVKLNERVYRFICEVDAPIGEVHDILCQMKSLVVQKMQELNEAQKAPVKEEDK